MRYFLIIFLLLPALAFSQGRTGVGPTLPIEVTPHPIEDNDGPLVIKFLNALEENLSKCEGQQTELRNLGLFYSDFRFKQIVKDLDIGSPKAECKEAENQIPKSYRCALKGKAKIALNELVTNPHFRKEIKLHTKFNKLDFKDIPMVKFLKDLNQSLQKDEKK